jgi:hypothetical protein
MFRDSGALNYTVFEGNSLAYFVRFTEYNATCV